MVATNDILRDATAPNSPFRRFQIIGYHAVSWPPFTVLYMKQQAKSGRGDKLARFQLPSRAMTFSLLARGLFAIVRFFLVVLMVMASLSLAQGQATTAADGKGEQAQLHCRLRQGLSSFVIQLEKLKSSHSVTLVNENSRAAGRMSIAVSDRALAANSPSWETVAGAIPFQHKRRFALSLVGVEASYVRLTFEVDAAPRVAGLD
jgi:hypothetical protein